MFSIMEIISHNKRGYTDIKLINWVNSKYDQVIAHTNGAFIKRSVNIMSPKDVKLFTLVSTEDMTQIEPFPIQSIVMHAPKLGVMDV